MGVVWFIMPNRQVEHAECYPAKELSLRFCGEMTVICTGVVVEMPCLSCRNSDDRNDIVQDKDKTNNT